MYFVYVGASAPRDMKVTGDGNMHWITPKKPNGDLSHFNIKYISMVDGTQQEVNTTSNYHTLTGVKGGHTYNITLMAVHQDGTEGERVMTTYFHQS